MATKNQTGKKNRRSWFDKHPMVTAGMATTAIVASIIVAVVKGSSNNAEPLYDSGYAPEPSPTTEPCDPSMGMIAECKNDPEYQKPLSVPYEELFRNSERYQGKFVKLKGEVIQVLGEAGQWELRVNVTNNSSYGVSLWEDTVLVTSYSDKRVIEKDIIEFTAQANGVQTYESAIGASVTIPHVIAIDTRVVGRTE